MNATIDAIVQTATAIGRLSYALDTMPAEALYRDLHDELRHDLAMHRRRLADLIAEVNPDPEEDPDANPLTDDDYADGRADHYEEF